MFLKEFSELQEAGQGVEKVVDDPRLPHGVLIHVKLDPNRKAPEQGSSQGETPDDGMETGNPLPSTKLPPGVPTEVLEKLLSIPDIEDFAVVTPVQLQPNIIADTLAERAQKLLSEPQEPPFDSYKLDLRGNRRGKASGEPHLDFKQTAELSQKALVEATQLPLCRKKNQADQIKDLEFLLRLKEQEKKQEQQKAAGQQGGKGRKSDGVQKTRPIYFHPLVFAVDCGTEEAWISDSTTITPGPALHREERRRERQKERNQQERTVYMSSIGELYLKKGNQARMVAELMSNAAAKLENLVSKVYRNGYYIVFEPVESAEVEEGDGGQTTKTLTGPELEKEIERRLACVPGIDLFSRARLLPSKFETLVERSVDGLLERYRATSGFRADNGKFTVQVRSFGRAPIQETEQELRNTIVQRFLREVRKEFGGSPEFRPPLQDSSRKLDGIALRLSGEITFLRHGEQLRGVGGQAEAQGRYTRSVVALLSGGFDSPVASWLMMKRGMRVHLVHFQNVNTLSQDAVKNKILELSRVLSRYQVNTDLYIVPFTEMQARIIESVPANSRMVVYRRFMMKIAGEYAKRTKSDFVVLGDSINQVASQTPDNLAAMYRLSEYPVLSPLIGLDKEEILEYSREIGTYDISALPYGDCCSYFLAKHPMLECKVDQLQSWEAAVQDSGVMQRALQYAQHIRFSGWEKMAIRKPGRLDHYSEEGNPGEDMDPDSCPWERKMSPEAMETEDLTGVDDAAIARARQEAESEVTAMDLEMDAAAEDGDGDVEMRKSRTDPRPLVGRKRPSDEDITSDPPAAAAAAAPMNGTLQQQQQQQPLRKKPRTSSSSGVFAGAQDITETAYFDNAATTPLLSGVLRDMLPFFLSPTQAPGLLGSSGGGGGGDMSPFLRKILPRGGGDLFANPHSAHGLGSRIQKVIAACREVLATSLGPGVEAKSIYFTSGGTEGNNMAIQGVLRFHRRAHPHQGNLNIVTTALEHDSVLKTCAGLFPELRIQVRHVKVDEAGRVDLEDLRRIMDRNTVLVTIMHGNNEIGTLQPLAAIHTLCREKGVLFHTDACQSYTKAPLAGKDADIVTLNAHKIHGPKGIGAIYISETARTKMDPLFLGGGQESNLRSGTLNVPGIVGMASAVNHSLTAAAGAPLGAGPGVERMKGLRDRLWNGIQEIYPEAVLNGPPLDRTEERLCNNISLYLNGSKRKS